jgi:peptidoglycan-N-acetylglucosamine deacetylase
VPSFLEQSHTLKLWQRFPGLQRLAAAQTVALTFDDGPDIDATPAILEALAAHGATATFFLLGEQIQRFEALARDIVGRGHEVGLHGFSHQRHDRLTKEQATEDLLQGLEIVEGTTGVRPRRFRPPYGRFSYSSYELCKRLGLQAVYWSAWGLDWEAVDAARIAELVGRDLGEGAIVLLHDSPRYASRPSCAPTAAAVSLICERASKQSLRVVSLDEAL